MGKSTLMLCARFWISPDLSARRRKKDFFFQVLLTFFAFLSLLSSSSSGSWKSSGSSPSSPMTSVVVLSWMPSLNLPVAVGSRTALRLPKPSDEGG